MPVIFSQGGPVVGVLAVGIRNDESALQELKVLTGSEVALVADGRVIGSTLPGFSGTGTWAGDVGRETAPVLVGGEHFLALVTADAQLAPGQGARYVLLLSYREERAVAGRDSADADYGERGGDRVERVCRVVFREPDHPAVARTARQCRSGGTGRFHPAHCEIPQRRVRRPRGGIQWHDDQLAVLGCRAEEDVGHVESHPRATDPE